MCEIVIGSNWTPDQTVFLNELAQQFYSYVKENSFEEDKEILVKGEDLGKPGYTFEVFSEKNRFYLFSKENIPSFYSPRGNIRRFSFTYYLEKNVLMVLHDSQESFEWSVNKGVT